MREERRYIIEDKVYTSLVGCSIFLPCFLVVLYDMFFLFQIVVWHEFSKPYMIIESVYFLVLFITIIESFIIASKSKKTHDLRIIGLPLFVHSFHFLRICRNACTVENHNLTKIYVRLTFYKVFLSQHCWCSTWLLKYTTMSLMKMIAGLSIYWCKALFFSYFYFLPFWFCRVSGYWSNRMRNGSLCSF